MSGEKIKAIYGTKDILPDEAVIWQRILSVVSRMASNYNYGFINPPIFEATELFTRGIGESSDVVSKEMYTFRDKGDRSLTLRPEGTASVVRSYIEHSLGARGGVFKVWYAGPMFRQERPQAGRYRQFYQFGIEAIGSSDPSLDAEIISLNRSIFSELGIDDLELSLNSIGMPGSREAHRQAFSDFINPMLGEFCGDCQRRFSTNPLRMFDCKEAGCQDRLAGAPVILDYISAEDREHFDRVLEFLELAGITYKIDKRMVRGLDYYTRTAWEIKSKRLGSQDSISGGGRYDLLVEQLGGQPTPGIGFAAGMERVILAMPDGAAGGSGRKTGVYIAIRHERFKTEAFKLSQALRGIGVPADLDYLGRSLKAQMKQADRSGLSHTMILAEDEMDRGAGIVRNLENSKQFEILLVDIYKMSGGHQFGEAIEKGEG